MNLAWLVGCAPESDPRAAFPPHCPEAPCVAALASAVADEPLPADWGGQTLTVWEEWAFVGAPASGVEEGTGGRNHVSVFHLPDLEVVGRWDGTSFGHDAAGTTLAIGPGPGLTLLIGAPSAEQDRGVGYVVDHVPNGEEDLEAGATVRFVGEERARVGTGLVAADLDGDGATDFGVSGLGVHAPSGEGDPARLFVVPASARGPLGPADATLSFEQSYGRFSRTFLFDLDRDGVDELFESGGHLRAHHLPLVDAEADVEFTTAHGGPVLDWTHVLGDVTGDGVPDLATFFLDHPDDRRRGLLVVIPGGTVGGDVDALPIRIEGTRVGDGLGRSAVSADMDGDGVLDLVVGAYGVYPAVDEPGRVLVFRGPLTGPLTADDAIATVSGEYASDMFGIALAVTDADGDLQADLVVTAQQHPAGANDGRVYVIPGRALVP